MRSPSRLDAPIAVLSASRLAWQRRVASTANAWVCVRRQTLLYKFEEVELFLANEINFVVLAVLQINIPDLIQCC